MINLKNLNIILTGSTGGIGGAILEKLNKCQANIIATGSKKEKLDLIKEKFKNVTVKQFDISNHSSIEQFRWPRFFNNELSPFVQDFFH